MFENSDQHESYGVIQISRGQIVGGGGTNLFGSSIEHHNIIELRIYTADVQRELAQDWIHPAKQLISVEMSPTQFADAMTSLNMGSGVPVTIKYYNGKFMAPCPHISKRKQFAQETEEHMKEVADFAKDALAKAQQAVDKKTPVGKGELKEILDVIVKLKQQIESNLPFLHSQFNRQMDKTVVEAKGEVEAFINNTITKLGLEKLKEQMPQIEGPDKNEEPK